MSGISELECGKGMAAASRSGWNALAGWAIALAAALTLYGATMAPGLAWGDAGYYQWESARLNLVRPGETVRVHPFFVVLAHALGQTGIWDYAKAASVASALGTAITVANVWLIVWWLTRRAAPATLAAMACMLAHTIWQQAVQPQTYGWSNAALSGMVLAAIAYVQSGRTAHLMWMFLVGGVGLSIHLMSQMGLAVLGVWVLVRVLRKRTPWWVLPVGAGLWILGAALFWYVVFLEYQRTGSAAETVQSALLGGWGSAVFNVSNFPRMAWRSLLMLVLNFPTPVALLGLYGLWRSRRILSGTPLAVLLGVMLAAYAAFGFRYRVPNQNFFFTPLYMLAAVYIGLGVHATGWTRRRPGLAALLVLMLAVAPAYWVMARTAEALKFNLLEGGRMHEIPYRNIYTYYLVPWQNGQVGPRRLAEEVMASLPPRAVLLPDSTTAPPLKCLHDVEGERPDVLIVDPYDALFDPSVRRLWHGQNDQLPALAAIGRRVFVMSDQPAYVPRWVAQFTCRRPFGILWEVVPCDGGGQP